MLMDIVSIKININDFKNIFAPFSELENGIPKVKCNMNIS